jgi:hypothetical protein
VKFAPLLAILLLAGCKLIDQTTFAPSPEAEPIPVVSGPPVPFDRRTPLVTIDFATAAPNYQDLLRLAVRQAQARDPAVQFDVVAVTKSLEGPPPQATAVMRTIMSERVPANRVHLGLHADPAVAALQVRVYVR